MDRTIRRWLFGLPGIDGYWVYVDSLGRLSTKFDVAVFVGTAYEAHVETERRANLWEGKCATRSLKIRRIICE